MEAVRTSETSVYSNETTRRYIPEDSKLHTHRREDLKCHTVTLISFTDPLASMAQPLSRYNENRNRKSNQNTGHTSKQKHTGLQLPSMLTWLMQQKVPNHTNKATKQSLRASMPLNTLSLYPGWTQNMDHTNTGPQ